MNGFLVRAQLGPELALSVATTDMGEHNVEQEVDERKLHEFMQALLADLRALAFMLEDGRIESGVRRIGAEQEMFLVDQSMRPAPLALEVLEQANDSRMDAALVKKISPASSTPSSPRGRAAPALDFLLCAVSLARMGAGWK